MDNIKTSRRRSFVSLFRVRSFPRVSHPFFYHGVVARVTKRLRGKDARSGACLFVCLFVCSFVCKQPRMKQTQLTALLKDFTGL